MESSGPILFFDGVCGLCSRFVDLLFRIDSAGVYRVAPLQGATAERLLPTRDREALESLVVWHEGRILRESDAVLKILRDLGPGWNFVAVFLSLCPRGVRNFLYRAVAERRYRVFGRSETCRLPTPQERSRFLD